MGKHEVIKSGNAAKSTERVRKYRAEMRAKGYRLKQVWVRDWNNPEFHEQLREECRIVAEFESANPDEMAFWNELAAQAWDDLPE
jgi:Protein  of unknown function (DUF3018)